MLIASLSVCDSYSFIWGKFHGMLSARSLCFALSSIELMIDHLGFTEQRTNCALFLRTDSSPSLRRDFYDSIQDVVLGDAPFSMVVAHCCGISVDWSS